VSPPQRRSPAIFTRPCDSSARGGRRLGEFREQARPHGIERRRRGSRIVDDFYLEHRNRTAIWAVTW
jgi:hypothetical protein